MQASWNHGSAYYRCKFPAEYAVDRAAAPQDRLRPRERDRPGFDAWIGSLFAEEHLDATCEALPAVSDLDPEDDPDASSTSDASSKIATPSSPGTGLSSSSDSDITIVANWIAEVERERKRLERELGRKPTSRKLTTAEIKALVASSRTSSPCWPTRTPQDKRAIYDELGVNLTYDPDGRVTSAQDARVLGVRVGGGT